MMSVGVVELDHVDDSGAIDRLAPSIYLAGV